MNDNIIGGVSPLKKKLLISGGKQYRGGTKRKSAGTKGKRGGGYGKSTSKVNPQGYTKNTRFRIPDKMQFPPGGGKTKPTTPTQPVTIGKDGLPEINIDFGGFDLSNTMGSMYGGDMSNVISNPINIDNQNINKNKNINTNTVENAQAVQKSWEEYKQDKETITEESSSRTSYDDAWAKNSSGWQTEGMKIMHGPNRGQRIKFKNQGEFEAHMNEFWASAEGQKKKREKSSSKKTTKTEDGQRWVRTCTSSGCGKWRKA